MDASQIEASLKKMGLMQTGEPLAAKVLSGGVSCDAYDVRIGARRVCLKQTLAKLRVAADWRAPQGRSRAEAGWMRLANEISPHAAPEILGEDPDAHIVAMEFFPPETNPVWKTLLAAGTASAEFAAETGALLARIHAATANRADLAERFANLAAFGPLRIEAYLRYTADRHPEVAAPIRKSANALETAQIALMHGDFSPKNILCGETGPVILDAETACYGDPAFDLAFCLNHFLLKGVWHPEHLLLYVASFSAMRVAYLAGATWEDREALDARAAGFLAAFLLARVDGKSPVEYLTKETDKAFVRETAITFLKDGIPRTAEIAARWFEKLSVYIAHG